jgi:hypothetical protein
MGGMAQTNQTQTNQTTQIIAKSRWYEIYRELDKDAIRLVAKYVDHHDASVYAMRVIEISGDMLRVYVRWNMPERRGEKLIKVIKLPDAAARWRNQIMHIASIKDFERLIWELDDIITQAEE